MKIISFIDDEGVIEKILKHHGLWEMKVRPPPKPKASLAQILGFHSLTFLRQP